MNVGPTVTIVIPSFQRAHLIKETLESVQKQTFSNWECLIIDDHSSDNTKEVVKPFIEKDRRFEYVLRPSNLKSGANSCRNHGFNISKGKYLKWVDSDDVLLPDCLEEQVNILESSSELKVCFGYGKFFNHLTNEKEEDWSRNSRSQNLFKDFLLHQIKWPIGGPLWRKSFFKISPFEQKIKNAQEWLMHGKALIELNDKEIYNLEKVVYLARRGHDNISNNIHSEYYFNRSISRFYLLKYLLKTTERNLNNSMILFQDAVFYFLIGIKLELKSLLKK